MKKNKPILNDEGFKSRFKPYINLRSRVNINKAIGEIIHESSNGYFGSALADLAWGLDDLQSVVDDLESLVDDL